MIENNIDFKIRKMFITSNYRKSKNVCRQCLQPQIIYSSHHNKSSFRQTRPTYQSTPFASHNPIPAVINPPHYLRTIDWHISSVRPSAISPRFLWSLPSAKHLSVRNDQFQPTQMERRHKQYDFPQQQRKRRKKPHTKTIRAWKHQSISLLRLEIAVAAKICFQSCDGRRLKRLRLILLSRKRLWGKSGCLIRICENVRRTRIHCGRS